MRLKKVMSLFLKAKCSVTALSAKKQCSAVQSTALHCGQPNENKGEIEITALTALDSAVTLHFLNKNNRFPSYARERAFYLKVKGRCAARPVGRGLAPGVMG